MDCSSHKNQFLCGSGFDEQVDSMLSVAFLDVIE